MNFLKTLILSFLFSLSAFAGNAVNINTASANAMADALDGIGVKRAEAIIAYRTEHGPFKTIDDLVKVPGISAKTIEKNRSLILLGDAADSQKSNAPTEPSKQSE